MREVGVVVGQANQALYWHNPITASSTFIDDDRGLWEFIWTRRAEVEGFAHVHPGRGLSSPSHTDVTTFAAIEAALGQRLHWWIVTEDTVALYFWEGPGRLDYKLAPGVSVELNNYGWAPELIRRSQARDEEIRMEMNRVVLERELEEAREEIARLRVAVEAVAMTGDELGDRMKMYEREAERHLMPCVPAVARLDGRCFSNFTRGMGRPFDSKQGMLMLDLLRWLVEETGAVIGYTQSDEISLVWYSASTKSQIYFNGRVQKMVSSLAASASVRFGQLVGAHMPEYALKMPTFDARVWSVPTFDEAVNALIWRQFDAQKNSIAMAARAHFSHASLLGLDGKQMQEKLFQEAGVNWNDYPAQFKRGVFVQRYHVTRPFSTEEIERLPPKHDARRNPGLLVERTAYLDRDLWLSKIKNRVAVIFEAAVPEFETET